MARLAGAAFLLVHVEEVHVRVAVAEVRELRRHLVEGDVLVVAVEAHGVVLGGVRLVELLREVLLEDLGVPAAVRVVAGGAGCKLVLSQV